ncbi:hypothetical protein FRC07_001168 [Ceratobasidium sp. 392]|nr:hypothetical protein FRC07_001168 [Ceratobasidium sp. 392]
MIVTNRFLTTGSGLKSNALKHISSYFGRHAHVNQPMLGRRLASVAAAEKPFPIVMVGSGNVMFGASHIDNILTRIQELSMDRGITRSDLNGESPSCTCPLVVGIVDPDTKRAHTALSRKRASADTAHSYANTQICSTISDLSAAHPPRLILIGSHPCSRGTDIPGRDLELQVIQQFPGVPIFVEKPVSTADVPATWRVAHKLGEKGVVCSVGYMLRYLKAVQRMKQIIKDNNLEVMGTNSRYYGAYSKGSRLDWWDKSREQGPIIEQATHFCDLARYFGGDVDLATVSARTVEWHERTGKLSRIPIDEALIAPENRIPRATSAIWKYQSGAIGSMTHSTILHGFLYACEFEVYCDGYTMRVSDPYGVPVLQVRQAGQDYEDVERYVDDDPFYSEVGLLAFSIYTTTSLQPPNQGLEFDRLD